jgi:multiple sugar transport system permease protein
MAHPYTSIVSPDAPPVQRNWWVYLIIVAVCVVNFLPYLWMVLTGFMDTATATRSSS